MTMLILIDLIIQLGFGLLYIANRKVIIEAARKEFYDIDAQYKMLNLTAALTVVAIWGTYCMLIHSVAPVLMSTAMKGWAVFLFLVVPTMLIPFWIYRGLIKLYVDWICKLVDDKKVVEANMTIAQLTIQNKDSKVEITRLREQIAKIQNEYQQRTIKLNTLYYQLSDIIRFGLMDIEGTARMTEYQIRTLFRPNHDNIIKSPSNDNAIFVRTDTLNGYEFFAPTEAAKMSKYYYEEEESRFLLAF